MIINISCEKSNLDSAPVANFTISPDSGNTEDFYTFNAISSSDKNDNISELLVRWDWKSDSVWDTQFSTSKTFQKRFNFPNTYSITLEVKNTGGLSDFITKQLVVSETTTGTLNDLRDEKVYKTVKIADQWWMSENLNHNISGKSWCYNDNPENCNIYGKLYELSTAYYACPNGWHLPSDEEWKKMELFLGMSQFDADYEGPGRLSGDVGVKLKSSTGWSGNRGGSNESGFNALPGGIWKSIYMGRNNIREVYEEIDISAYFWTNTEASNSAYIRHLSLVNDVQRTRIPKTWRLSVRCVKD